MPATFMDRDTFLANLKRSSLIASEELSAVVSQLPETKRGRLVARELVQRGLLTRFQAEMLLAGRTGGFILGQYRILDQAGRGGMGRVFKAMHQTMNRIVALKVISPSLVKTSKAQQMFQREVQAAARLLHPNIVTAYDANQIGDRHYLVMEFVDGPNLEQYVSEKGPLPAGQACDFIRQAANGLQFASEMGMVHRDIKPSNLLVKQADGDAPGRPCVVKILDFGLARLHAPLGKAEAGIGSVLVKPNVVLGTPDYIAPEQAQDIHKADIRSDLYSLGCTFYYLLTSRVPFPGGTMVEKLVRQATETPVPVEQLRPDLPAGVAAIVAKLMAKSPSDRYQSPAELAAALTAFATAGPAVWTPPVPDDPFTDLHSPQTATPAAFDASVNTVDEENEANPSGNPFSFFNDTEEDSVLGSMPAESPAMNEPQTPRRRTTESAARQRRIILIVAISGAALALLILGLLLAR